MTGKKASLIAGDLSAIVSEVKLGKGAAGTILTNESFSRKLNQSMTNIKSISDTFVIISNNLKDVTKNLKNKNGAMGTILNDTTFANNLNVSMLNITHSTTKLNENLEALKYSWPFKKYFRKIKNKKQ